MLGGSPQPGTLASDVPPSFPAKRGLQEKCPKEIPQEFRMRGCQWSGSAAGSPRRLCPPLFLHPPHPAAPVLCLGGHGHLLTEGKKASIHRKLESQWLRQQENSNSRSGVQTSFWNQARVSPLQEQALYWPRKCWPRSFKIHNL